MTKFYFYKSKLTGLYYEEVKQFTDEKFLKHFTEVTEEEYRQHIKNSMKGIK